MKGHERGWTVFCVEEAVETIEAMPRHVRDEVISHLTSLAVTAGSAIDAGKQPPGHAMDDQGIHFGHAVEGEPVLFEYTVVVDIRELRIDALVWLG